MTSLFECGTCGKEFPAGWRARENHCYSTGHRRPTFECDSCPRYFSSEHARWQHMCDKNHFELGCSRCDDTFPSEAKLTEHEIDDHHYCADCDRTFLNHNNIKMHLNSATHRGHSITCPFCKNNFATATGLTHHLEQGCCPSAPHLNRDQLYNLVRSRDPDGVVAKKLIGWTGSSQYEATGQAWNGEAYECYFCSRNFGRLSSLNQHLSSPTHQQKLYHCPNRNCRQEFVSLGATINHLESESCGFIKFERVQQSIGNIVNSNRLIGF